MSLEEDKCNKELKRQKEKKKCTNYITISKLKKNKSKESLICGLRGQNVFEKKYSVQRTINKSALTFLINCRKQTSYLETGW